MQYRMWIEYDGGSFAGWQVQPNARTVQGELEGAVRRLFGEDRRVHAAGRTDAGVHARGQVATFRSERTIPLPEVCRAINALTSCDVAVRAVDRVPDDFDPRRSARARRYVYRIWNRSVSSPFWRHHAWHVRHSLDPRAMQRGASRLLGEHDFTSFRAAGCDAAHPVRRVSRSRVERRGDLLLYEVEANAFLRHMVRNIVGTLVEVGSGRRSPESLTELLVARDRARAGVTAPAHGLCLEEVRYEEQGAGRTAQAADDSIV